MDKKKVRRYSSKIPKAPPRSQPPPNDSDDEVRETRPLKEPAPTSSQLKIPRSTPSFTDVLSEAFTLNTENVNLMSFIEDDSVSYLDRATLTLTDPPYVLPPLRIDCRVQELSVFPHSVVGARNRRRRQTSLDEYSVHAELDPSSIDGFNGMCLTSGNNT